MPPIAAPCSSPNSLARIHAHPAPNSPGRATHIHNATPTIHPSPPALLRPSETRVSPSSPRHLLALPQARVRPTLPVIAPWPARSPVSGLPRSWVRSAAHAPSHPLARTPPCLPTRLSLALLAPGADAPALLICLPIRVGEVTSLPLPAAAPAPDPTPHPPLLPAPARPEPSRVGAMSKPVAPSTLAPTHLRLCCLLTPRPWLYACSRPLASPFARRDMAAPGPRMPFHLHGSLAASLALPTSTCHVLYPLSPLHTTPPLIALARTRSPTFTPIRLGKALRPPN
ncbi:hypothetical protein FRC08_001670 [Ceratobasidium sp. 394]|nr:hypothetical protein FRC08_001670 [Ceratobasidium sp. 394]